MEQSTQGKRKAVALLTTDPVLLELITAELAAMHIDCIHVPSPEDIPTDGSLAIVDLDAFQVLPEAPLPARLIGVSRRESTLPETRRARFHTILHRPFPLAGFRSVLLDAVTASETPSAHADGGQPRRMAVRRLPRRAPSLSPSPSGRSILANGAEIALTPGEMTVFLALFRADGETVTRETLSRILQNDSRGNLPDVHVCAIRKKLAPHGMDTLLHTVRGLGYRLLRPETHR